MRRLPALLVPFAIASAAIAQLPQPSLPSPLLATPDERVPEHLRASVVALAPDDAAWRARTAAGRRSTSSATTR